MPLLIAIPIIALAVGIGGAGVGYGIGQAGAGVKSTADAATELATIAAIGGVVYLAGKAMKAW